MSEIDRLAARHGFPKPIDTGFRPQVAAQIDLTETFERTTCCCTLHGSLHNARTCCPVHAQTRAGIAVPAMTPIAAEPDPFDDPAGAGGVERDWSGVPITPTYDTTLDPCSPDFDLSSWA